MRITSRYEFLGILSIIGVIICYPIAGWPQGPKSTDIEGLTTGMSYEEVVAVLKKRADVKSIGTSHKWIRQKQGAAQRQIVRGLNGTPCSVEESQQRRSRVPKGSYVDCETYGKRFRGRKEVTNEIMVGFIGAQGREVAVSIWRRTRFKKGDNPTVASLEKTLAKKYSNPHMRQTEKGVFSATHRKGAINLDWVFAADGKRITSPDVFIQRCVNNPKLWFAGDHSWSEACGLTIRAEILPLPENRLLTQELNITVVDQNFLVKTLIKFDEEIKAADKKKAGQKSRKSDR